MRRGAGLQGMVDAAVLPTLAMPACGPGAGKANAPSNPVSRTDPLCVSLIVMQGTRIVMPLSSFLDLETGVLPGDVDPRVGPVWAPVPAEGRHVSTFSRLLHDGRREHVWPLEQEIQPDDDLVLFVTWEGLQSGSRPGAGNDNLGRRKHDEEQKLANDRTGHGLSGRGSPGLRANVGGGGGGAQRRHHCPW